MTAPDCSLPPAFPTLAVSDLAAAARWYHDALHFRVIAEWPSLTGLPALIHLRRARFQDVMLAVAALRAETPHAHEGIELTFLVDEDVVELARLAEVAGATLVQRPDSPARARGREVSLRDPDGHRLTFVQVGDASRNRD